MKVTAEIIKEGLTHCNLTEKVKCDNCPYARIELADDERCSERLARDIIAFIDKLTKANDDLTEVIFKKEDLMQKIATERNWYSDRAYAVGDDALKSVRTKLAMHFGTYLATDTIKVTDMFALVNKFSEEALEELNDEQGICGS